MISPDRNYWEIINLLFVLLGLYLNITLQCMRKHCNFGAKNSRRDTSFQCKRLTSIWSRSLYRSGGRKETRSYNDYWDSDRRKIRVTHAAREKEESSRVTMLSTRKRRWNGRKKWDVGRGLIGRVSQLFYARLDDEELSCSPNLFRSRIFQRGWKHVSLFPRESSSRVIVFHDCLTSICSVRSKKRKRYCRYWILELQNQWATLDTRA